MTGSNIEIMKTNSHNQIFNYALFFGAANFLALHTLYFDIPVLWRGLHIATLAVSSGAMALGQIVSLKNGAVYVNVNTKEWAELPLPVSHPIHPSIPLPVPFSVPGEEVETAPPVPVASPSKAPPLMDPMRADYLGIDTKTQKGDL